MAEQLVTLKDVPVESQQEKEEESGGSSTGITIVAAIVAVLLTIFLIAYLANRCKSEEENSSGTARKGELTA